MQMKQQIRKIYNDLLNGTLSKKEAFERIKALKLQQRTETGTLQAYAVWEERRGGGRGEKDEEREVLVCGLGKVEERKLERMVGGSRCERLKGGEGGSLAEGYSEYAVECFERVQEILRRRPAGKVRVQVVAEGGKEQGLMAGLTGLLKTAAVENPQVVGQVILVGGETTTEELSQVLEGEEGESAVVRYEEGRREVLGWREMAVEGEEPGPCFGEEGVYLITGGLGGLGRIFAEEILRRTRGAQVVLTGRGELSEEKERSLAGLGGSAGRVSYRQVDLRDVEQVRELVARIQEQDGRLKGVVHSAGMIADNFLVKKRSEEFRQVLEPKVRGTWNLDEATKEVELDFFVLFSSIAGALGNVGQGDYAAGNGFMDRFAEYRNGLVEARQRYGRTRTINWPLWAEGGMRVEEGSAELLRQRTGMRAMETGKGLKAFYRSLAQPYGQVLVMAGEVEAMRRAVVGEAIEPERGPSAAGEGSREEAVAREKGASGLAEKTEEYLRRQLAGLLQMPWEKLDPGAGLERYGIDSILAMKLTSHLEQTFGALSKTLFFEYQTIAELSGYFLQAHGERLGRLFAGRESGGGEKRKVEDGLAVAASRRSVQREG